MTKHEIMKIASRVFAIYALLAAIMNLSDVIRPAILLLVLDCNGKSASGAPIGAAETWSELWAGASVFLLTVLFGVYFWLRAERIATLAVGPPDRADLSLSLDARRLGAVAVAVLGLVLAAYGLVAMLSSALALGLTQLMVDHEGLRGHLISPTLLHGITGLLKLLIGLWLVFKSPVILGWFDRKLTN